MAHLHIRDTVLSERRLPLPGRVVVLGRSLDVDVPLPHRSVSRRHALIELGGSGYHLSDLGSSNGTFLGERRLASGERVALPLGSPFRVGEVTLLLVADEVLPAEDEASAPPPARTPAPPPPVSPSAPTTGSLTPARSAARKVPPARRATRHRERRQAARWLTVIVTVVLLGVAGLFLAKIVENAGPERGKSGGEAPAAKEEEPDESREIRTLKPPGEKR